MPLFLPNPPSLAEFFSHFSQRSLVPGYVDHGSTLLDIWQKSRYKSARYWAKKFHTLFLANIEDKSSYSELGLPVVTSKQWRDWKCSRLVKSRSAVIHCNETLLTFYYIHDSLLRYLSDCLLLLPRNAEFPNSFQNMFAVSIAFWPGIVLQRKWIKQYFMVFAMDSTSIWLLVASAAGIFIICHLIINLVKTCRLTRQLAAFPSAPSNWLTGHLNYVSLSVSFVLLIYH